MKIIKSEEIMTISEKSNQCSWIYITDYTYIYITDL